MEISYLNMVDLIGDVVFEMEVHDVDSNPEPLVYGIYSTDIADPPPPFVMDNKTGTNFKHGAYFETD